MSEDTESETEFLTQVFPVPESDTDEPPDPQKALTSPEDYIRFVRHEAESYPAVFYSPALLTENQSNAVCVQENVFQSPVSSTEQEVTWTSLFMEAVEGPWIFALLVALEKPIHPDTYHTLRTIAKRCRKLKKELGESLSKAEIQLFDLCPYLVAKVFGQLDLLLPPPDD
ncbi:unnamed protein product [Echinostoma caproni]|uniref:NR LBD domain-containing protein n=1 Tax=Echinostoma caproni TaxID=27848 RepID=A0A183B7S5_9TREM|nr:unnamed protein product [Echinostoma caproni]